MEDEIVQKIVSDIVQTFKDAYGHSTWIMALSGEAQGDNMAMINTTRTDGKQIIIKIEIKD